MDGDAAALTLPRDADPVGLEALAVRLVVQAGRFIRDSRPESVRVTTTKSTALDVVTAMDTGSERLLREVVARARPKDGILGEEEGLLAGSSGLTWVLDPIDGTVNYLYDLPAYAVSVAVVLGDPTVPGGWRPVAGAVVNPRVGEVFHARDGGGAWVRRLASGLDGSPGADGNLGEPGAATALRVAVPANLEETLVGTGFSYDRALRREQGRVATEVLVRVRDLRRIGSAALDLCSVAAGRMDGYYESGLYPWDLAAGQLLVTEAGGVVTGLDGPAGRDMVLAGAPHTHAALHALLVDLGAGERNWRPSLC